MDVSGASDLHGAVKAYGTLEVDGESTLASAIVEDLTNTRVTFAGAGGALVDDAKMTFASGVLTVSGSTFSKDVTIVGNLTVQGATTTVDTQNLIVADAKIVISSGGIVDAQTELFASSTPRGRGGGNTRPDSTTNLGPAASGNTIQDPFVSPLQAAQSLSFTLGISGSHCQCLHCASDTRHTLSYLPSSSSLTSSSSWKQHSSYIFSCTCHNEPNCRKSTFWDF
jgi:hypothetical protein